MTLDMDTYSTGDITITETDRHIQLNNKRRMAKSATTPPTWHRFEFESPDNLSAFIDRLIQAARRKWRAFTPANAREITDDILVIDKIMTTDTGLRIKPANDPYIIQRFTRNEMRLFVGILKHHRLLKKGD